VNLSGIKSPVVDHGQPMMSVQTWKADDFRSEFTATGKGLEKGGRYYAVCVASPPPNAPSMMPSE
jgi:hypothetical protein